MTSFLVGGEKKGVKRPKYRHIAVMGALLSYAVAKKLMANLSVFMHLMLLYTFYQNWDEFGGSLCDVYRIVSYRNVTSVARNSTKILKTEQKKKKSGVT